MHKPKTNPSTLTSISSGQGTLAHISFLLFLLTLAPWFQASPAGPPCIHISSTPGHEASGNSSSQPFEGDAFQPRILMMACASLG